MNRNRATLIIVLVATHLFDLSLHAQTNKNLFGVKIFQPNRPGFVEINKTTGITSLINYLTPAVHAYGGSVLDSKNKRYFVITADSINMYLKSYDIATGQQINILFTQDSVGDGQPGYITISSAITNPFYNCFDDHIYFFNFKHQSHDTFYLKKVDPLTTIVTSVHAIPSENLVHYPVMGFQSQKIFWVSWDEPTTLFSYDLSTGISDSIILSESWDNSIEVSLTYNLVDGYLYGVDEYGYSMSDYMGYNKLLKINPSTGKVDFISETIHANIVGYFAINESGDRAYFFGQNTNPGKFNLYNFDLKHNSFVTHECDAFVGPEYFFNSTPDTSFTVSNFCQHAPTNFNVVNGQAFSTWNFGDSFSINNTSSGAHVTHAYDYSGTYTVNMISSTCYGIDTVQKQITIEQFPEINIGNDTTVCSNQPIDPILFKASAPSSTFIWQDGSTTSEYSSTAPELITVAINNSCGTVRDSAIISGINCPCGIEIYPDLTSNNFSYYIQCLLSNYPNFRFELFDLVGRRIIESEITSNEYIINTNNLAAGTYIYRFKSEKEILKTGKIIIIH